MRFGGSIRFAFFLVLLLSLNFAQVTDFASSLSDIRDLLNSVVPIVATLLIVLSAVAYVIGQLFGAETRARANVWATSLFTGAIIGLLFYVIINAIIAMLDSSNGIPLFFFAPRASQVFIQFIMMSLVLGALISAMYFFASYFFQSPQLNAMAKDEVAALILSVLIIFLWVFFDGFFNNLTRGLICMGSQSACSSLGANLNNPGFQIDLARGTLDILFTKLKGFYTQLYLFEVLVGFLSTLSFPIGTFLPGANLITVSFAPYDGLVLLSNAHTVVVEAIGYLMMAIWAKQFILDFAKYSIPILLLPLGIALRAIPFFRTTGSSLIAICIILYFVYPLSIMLSSYMIFDVYKPGDITFVPKFGSFFPNAENFDLASEQSVINQKIEELEKLFERPNVVSNEVTKVYGNAGFIATGGDMAKNIGSVFVSGAKTIWTILEFMCGLNGDALSVIFTGQMFLPTQSGAALFKFVVQEVTIIGTFVGLVTFTSVLELIISITMYRNIAMLIGGEVELIGLSKLV